MKNLDIATSVSPYKSTSSVIPTASSASPTSNTKKSSSTAQTINTVANTINTGLSIYDKLSGQNKINTGENVKSESTAQAEKTGTLNTNQNVTSTKSNELDTALPTEYVTDVAGGKSYGTTVHSTTPDYSFLSGYTQNLEKASVQSGYKESTLPLSQRTSPTDFVNISTNADGSYAIQGKPYNTPEGSIYNNNYGNYNYNLNVARGMALPVTNYAANFNSYDAPNKIIQGTRALGDMLTAASTGSSNPNAGSKLVDDYALTNFAQIADLTHNWNNRTDMQNAIRGVSTATNLISKLGLEKNFGGSGVLGAVNGGVGYYTFGNSIYNLTKNWGSMNGSEKAAAVLYTVNAGTQAYDNTVSLINTMKGLNYMGAMAPQAVNATGAAGAAGATAASQAAWNSGAVAATNASAGAASTAGASAAGAGAASTAAGTGTVAAGTGTAAGASAASQTAWNAGAMQASNQAAANTTGAMLGSALSYAALAYSSYMNVEALQDNWGQGTNQSRKNLAMSGAAVGASIGTCICPGWGTAIGAAVGAVVGTVQGCIKTGKSQEQQARDTYRSIYAKSGVFSETANGSYGMQLSDGRWYDVGIDGSGNYATDITGAKKEFYDTSVLTEESRQRVVNSGHEGGQRGVLPYEVDYTNNLDYTTSIMLSPIAWLPAGGSAAREEASEVDQMLGLMTNGATSNCGRELTKENWDITIGNVRSLYGKLGMYNREYTTNAIAEAYFQGKLNQADYQTSLLGRNLVWDDDGYNQAIEVNTALGRNVSGVVPSNVQTTAPTSISGDTRGL